MSDFDWINRTYGLAIKRGTRARYTGAGSTKLGVVTGEQGGHLLILMDSDGEAFPYHPTWELELLPTQGEEHGR